MENNSDRLILARCRSCGTFFLPPLYVCSECGSMELQDVPSNGEGKILSYTTVRVAPLGFTDQAPYEIAVVELPEKVNVTARIVVHEGKAVGIGGSASFVKKDTSGAYWFKLSN